MARRTMVRKDTLLQRVIIMFSIITSAVALVIISIFGVSFLRYLDVQEENSNARIFRNIVYAADSALKGKEYVGFQLEANRVVRRFAATYLTADYRYISNLLELTYLLGYITASDPSIDAVSVYSPGRDRFYHSGTAVVAASELEGLTPLMSLVNSTGLGSAWVFLSQEHLGFASQLAQPGILTHVAQIPLYSESPRGLVMVHVGKALLSSIAANYDRLHSFALMTPGGTVVLKGSSAGLSRLRDRAVPAISSGGGESGFADLGSSGFAVRSQVGDWYYLGGLGTTRRVSREAGFIATVTGLSLVLVLAIVLVTRGLTLRMFAPLESFVAAVGGEEPDPFLARSRGMFEHLHELATLSHYIEGLSETSRRLLEESAKSRHQFFLRRVLRDSHLSPDLDDEVAELRRRLRHPALRVVLVESVSPLGGGDRAQVRRWIDCFARRNRRNFRYEQIDALSNQQAIVLNYRRMDDTAVVEGLRTSLKRSGPSNLSIAVGMRVSGIAELHRSYDDAREALDLVPATAPSSIREMPEILRENGRAMSDVLPSLSALARAVSERNISAVRRCVSAALDRIDGQALRGVAASLVHSQIEHQLSLVLRDLGVEASISRPPGAPSEASILAMVDRIEAAADAPRHGEVSRRSIAEQIVHHIAASYTDPMLSLNTVAETFGMSVASVNRYLREYSSRNFKAWLTHYRMNRAKDLLLSRPETAVSTVSAQCGYLDPHSFARSFKSYHGASPSAFRRTRIRVGTNNDPRDTSAEQ